MIFEKMDKGKKRKAESELPNPRQALDARALLSASAPRAQPLRTERVVDQSMATRNPEKFLRDAFLNENGEDAAYSPVALEGLSPSERAHLHQQCTILNLRHQTDATGTLIIGSKRNTLADEMLRRSRNTMGWRPELFVAGKAHFNRNYEIGDWRFLLQDPGAHHTKDYEIGDWRFEFLERGSNANGRPATYNIGGGRFQEVQRASNAHGRLAESYARISDQVWDITGDWTLICPAMSMCFGQQRPYYKLSIYSDDLPTGRQLYGRFNFGTYTGVVRFCGQPADARAQPDDRQFVLGIRDQISPENPSMGYRWRGKERGENVIQLGEDSQLYTMTFSDGGQRVEGTWGTTRSDPGPVTFAGRKFRAHRSYEHLDIVSEWNDLDEAAYDNANRDRWRRRY